MNKKISTKGVFVGTPSNIIAFGYITEEEGDKFAAVCINLNIVGQGDSPHDAMDNLIDSAHDYITFLQEKYPDSWEEKVERDAPKEFVNEFESIASQFMDLVHKEKKNKRIRERSLTQGNLFAKPLSACFA